VKTIVREKDLALRECSNSPDEENEPREEPFHKPFLIRFILVPESGQNPSRILHSRPTRTISSSVRRGLKVLLADSVSTGPRTGQLRAELAIIGQLTYTSTIISL
jgi:hypothetical protein